MSVLHRLVAAACFRFVCAMDRSTGWLKRGGQCALMNNCSNAVWLQAPCLVAQARLATTARNELQMTLLAWIRSQRPVMSGGDRKSCVGSPSLQHTLDWTIVTVPQGRRRFPARPRCRQSPRRGGGTWP